LAGGADVILIPEIPYNLRKICEKVEDRRAGGRKFSIVVEAEGARSLGGSLVYKERVEESLGQGRLGGIADVVCSEVTLENSKEGRITVLGHLQRGGSPTPFDRALATRFGSTAVHLMAEKNFGTMVALQ